MVGHGKATTHMHKHNHVTTKINTMHNNKGKLMVELI